MILFFFFFNDTATTEIYTLSLHDALPISMSCSAIARRWPNGRHGIRRQRHEPRTPGGSAGTGGVAAVRRRSEEHTSELQSQSNLVCRLLLEKKNFKVYDSASIRSQLEVGV